jgi:hypothetical protein
VGVQRQGILDMPLRPRPTAPRRRAQAEETPAVRKEGRGHGLGGDVAKLSRHAMSLGATFPLGEAADYPANGTARVMRGSAPTPRVIWPLPVRSSATRTSPGTRCRVVPSLISISSAPDIMTTYCRRGAL